MEAESVHDVTAPDCAEYRFEARGVGSQEAMGEDDLEEGDGAPEDEDARKGYEHGTRCTGNPICEPLEALKGAEHDSGASAEAHGRQARFAWGKREKCDFALGQCQSTRSKSDGRLKRLSSRRKLPPRCARRLSSLISTRTVSSTTTNSRWPCAPLDSTSRRRRSSNSCASLQPGTV